MDLLVFSVYLVPFTLVGWIIYLFKFKTSKKGMMIYFGCFVIYLLLAAGFLIWAASETGWLGGIGPIMVGGITLVIYSIIAFIALGLVRRSLLRSENNSK